MDKQEQEPCGHCGRPRPASQSLQHLIALLERAEARKIEETKKSGGQS